MHISSDRGGDVRGGSTGDGLLRESSGRLGKRIDMMKATRLGQERPVGLRVVFLGASLLASVIVAMTGLLGVMDFAESAPATKSKRDPWSVEGDNSVPPAPSLEERARMSSSVVGSRGQGPAAAVRRESSGRSVAGLTDRAHFASGNIRIDEHTPPISLSSSARTDAVFEDGRLVEVVFEEIVSDGFYDRIGFEQGDALRAINRTDIADVGSPVFLFGELAISDEIEMEVMRADGSYHYLKVPTADLWEQLVAEGELSRSEIITRFFDE